MDLNSPFRQRKKLLLSPLTKGPVQKNTLKQDFLNRVKKKKRLACRIVVLEIVVLQTMHEKRGFRSLEQFGLKQYLEQDDQGGKEELKVSQVSGLQLFQEVLKPATRRHIQNNRAL